MKITKRSALLLFKGVTALLVAAAVVCLMARLDAQFRLTPYHQQFTLFATCLFGAVGGALGGTFASDIDKARAAMWTKCVRAYYKRFAPPTTNDYQ
jgi:hypothetical protein